MSQSEGDRCLRADGARYELLDKFLELAGMDAEIAIQWFRTLKCKELKKFGREILDKNRECCSIQ